MHTAPRVLPSWMLPAVWQQLDSIPSYRGITSVVGVGSSSKHEALTRFLFPLLYVFLVQSGSVPYKDSSGVSSPGTALIWRAMSQSCATWYDANATGTWRQHHWPANRQLRWSGVAGMSHGWKEEPFSALNGSFGEVSSFIRRFTALSQSNVSYTVYNTGWFTIQVGPLQKSRVKSPGRLSAIAASK